MAKVPPVVSAATVAVVGPSMSKVCPQSITTLITQLIQEVIKHESPTVKSNLILQMLLLHLQISYVHGDGVVLVMELSTR